VNVGSGKAIVIAELGINHNGDLKTALAMVDAAAEAGCDAVKIQAYDAEEFCGPEETYTYTVKSPSVTRTQSKAFAPAGEFEGSPVYISPTREVTERQVDMFRRCQLNEDQIKVIHAFTKEKKMAFVATATDPYWIDFLKDKVDAFKVGSDDIVHIPLVRSMKATGRPVILSTGMANGPEIATAVGELGDDLMALLHCVSLYPTTYAQANLKRMWSLSDEFGVPVGFSDHTEGTAVSMVAISMGATVIEKHFTLSQFMAGPDHRFSATKDEMKKICEFARNIQVIQGTGGLRPGAGETEMALIARRSIIARRTIAEGETIVPSMIAFKRPGDGLPPSAIDLVVGSVAVKPIVGGQKIMFNDLRQGGRVN
jgi:sialic acid synthase SpsE